MPNHASDALGHPGASSDFYSNIMAAEDQSLNIPNFVNHLRRNIVTACFSKRLDNLSMWATYANSHNGVALQFSVQAFEDNESAIVLKEVEYTDKAPKISFPDICLYRFLLARVAVNEIDPNFSALSLERQFTQFKNRSFSSEEEWRLLGFDGKVDTYSRFSGLTLDAIYFGANLDQSRASEIVQQFGKRVAIFGMNRASAGYRFNCVKLTWHDDGTYEWVPTRSPS
jgi:hypothetical protein